MGRRLAVALLAILAGAVPAAAEDSAAERERAALARVLTALEDRPPSTVRDYRVAFRELGLVGDSALPHLRALVRRYVDGPGFDDREAHAFLGDRRFHHPIPEVVTFRGHPFLRRIEAANAKAWFRADEQGGWNEAQAARRAMRLHHRRLLEDHRYRAGDQQFANVALDPQFEELDLRFRWADPFAIVEVGAPRSPEALAAAIATLQGVYRRLLTDHGEVLGLRDLMAPWGGRPDASPRERSFEDGAPLPVLLYTERAAFCQVLWHRRRAPTSSASLAALMSPNGVLHVVETERLAEAAALQALHWFRRQRSAWGRGFVGHDALADGFGAFVASTWDGTLVASNLEKARARAAAFEKRERPYPVIPVSVLVRVGSDREARRLLATVGVPASLVTPLYREQAWALVRMLYDGEDGRYRPSLYAYLRAWLEGETAYGMAKQQFQRAFDLRGEEEWKALDGAWERYVRKTILGRDDE